MLHDVAFNSSQQMLAQINIRRGIELLEVAAIYGMSYCRSSATSTDKGPRLQDDLEKELVRYTTIYHLQQTKRMDPEVNQSFYRWLNVQLLYDSSVRKK